MFFRLLFLLTLLVTLVCLLATGAQVLAAKLWLVSWLPFVGQLDNATSAGHADKVAHALLFATMGALAVRAWSHNCMQLAWVLMGVLWLAPLTEWLQAWVPGRGSSWADGAADTLGLALGAGLTWRAGRATGLPQITVKGTHA